MDGVRVEGQTIGQTYELVADVVGDPTIASLQCDFFVCEADYLRLTTHGSRYYDAAVAVLLVSVGYGVSVVAKLASSAWSDTSVHVEGGSIGQWRSASSSPSSSSSSTA